MQPSGLLFYNGRLNEKHDFLALELVAGQVRLTYSTGEWPEAPQALFPVHLHTRLSVRQTAGWTWLLAVPCGEASLNRECVCPLCARRPLAQPVMVTLSETSGGGAGWSSCKHSSCCTSPQVSPTRWSAPQFQGA